MRLIHGEEYGFDRLSFVLTETQPNGGPPLHTHTVQVVDAAGANRSGQSLSVRAVGVVQVSSQIAGYVENAGNANPDFGFRYDAELVGYVYNLKTSGISTGTYDVQIQVAGDPILHTARFQVR